MLTIYQGLNNPHSLLHTPQFTGSPDCRNHCSIHWPLFLWRQTKRHYIPSWFMTAYFPLLTLQGDKRLPSSEWGWYQCKLCLPVDPYEVFICAPLRTLHSLCLFHMSDVGLITPLSCAFRPRLSASVWEKKRLWANSHGTTLHFTVVQTLFMKLIWLIANLRCSVARFHPCSQILETFKKTHTCPKKHWTSALTSKEWNPTQSQQYIWNVTK